MEPKKAKKECVTLKFISDDDVVIIADVVAINADGSQRTFCWTLEGFFTDMLLLKMSYGVCWTIFITFVCLL